MAGLDEVMERLLIDQEFRRQLATNPAGALADYELSGDDHQVLAAALTYDEGTSGTMEQRTTQSTMAGLFSALQGGIGPAGSSAESVPGRINAVVDGDADRAVPWTAIAQAESGGNSSQQVDIPTPGEASGGSGAVLAADAGARSGGHPGTAHVSISLGDGRTVESGPDVVPDDASKTQ
jgi:hypothetical protein